MVRLSTKDILFNRVNEKDLRRKTHANYGATVGVLVLFAHRSFRHKRLY